MSIDPNSNAELLTVAEVAEQLRISVSGVRRLQQARQLPFIKVGGSIRFFKSDIFAYLKQHRVGSIGQ
jgi:excisionase family DNA binding protein